MPQNVAVVIVHGINTEGTGFSARYRSKVSKALPSALRDRVAFSEVFWVQSVRDRQSAYLRSVNRAGVKKSWSRDVVVQALGDAAAYQKTAEIENSVYFDVQYKIVDRLQSLAVSEGPETPLIFVGHSLGCHIVSSFAWDVHNWRRRTDAEIDSLPEPQMRDFANEIRRSPPLVRLETFAGFITLGNNMPLFTFTFGPKSVYPITETRYPQASPAFPGSALSPQLKEGARWLNIYSPNDPLGFPLKPLNDHYANAERLQDMAHNVENWWWPSPYDAHVRYWTNGRVVTESARLIREVLEAS